MPSVLLDLPVSIPWDAIAPADIPAAIRQLVADADARLTAVAACDGPRTWDNTGAVLDRATEPLDRAWTVVGHVRAVNASDELEAAYNEVNAEVSSFYAGIFLRDDLWSALRTYADTDDARALTGARRRWLDKTLAAFRRNGAELQGSDKVRYAEIIEALAVQSSTFMRHVLQATASWSLPVDDAARLQGLPESARGMMEAIARSRGQETGWLVILNAPVVTAILTYADDRALREEVWGAWNQRASSGELDNQPVIREMLALRREQARLLGFADFADFVLSDRMAHDGATASTFVERLEDAARAAFERENTELVAFVTERGGPLPLQPWDVGYWAEKQRKARYDFDEEAVRPWFRYESVLDGLFGLVQRLYGVTITPSDRPSWHPDAACWSLRDAEGRELGVFHTDFFPRQTKRDGAWMNALQTGRDGTPHVGLMCGNFTPATPDRPALLTHREVETLFHELGHLLHHLLTRTELYSQAGTNVAWDFVELPSQIMENWTWEREALDVFARHHETGERLPDELFDRMTRARNFRSAAFMMRQLGFCRVDLDLHRTWDEARDGDPLSFGRRVLERYSATALPEGFAMLTAFSHLFADAVGYAAGYYSYQWAAVLDADAFTRFQAEGLFNPATGAAFREAILAAGDSDDPAALFRSFLGRDPDVRAHLRRSGLHAA
jgi:oligopeptidase A